MITGKKHTFKKLHMFDKGENSKIYNAKIIDEDGKESILDYALKKQKKHADIGPWE